MTVWWTQTFQKPAPFLTRRKVSVRIQIKTRGWLLNKQPGELEVDDLNILSNLGWWCVCLPSCRESISLSMTWGSGRHWARSASVVTKLLNVKLVLDILPIIWTKYVHFQARRTNEGNEQTFLNFKIFFIIFIFSSVQFTRSVVSNSLQPHELQHARPPCLSPTPWLHPNSHPSSRWCHPAISSCRPLLLLPPIPPSIRVFSNESTLRIRWPKYWSFSFSISPSNEHPGLISFRMDRLDLLAVQGTLKSLLQHHSSKASILRRSAFFIVQLSHPYMTTGKTIALTKRTFVDKVMSLLFNMLSRLVIGRRQWHPTPVLLPGKSHGRRSLVDCNPWGR